MALMTHPDLENDPWDSSHMWVPHDVESRFECDIEGCDAALDWNNAQTNRGVYDLKPGEKLYLVHAECGEVFDDIHIAYYHKCPTDDDGIFTIRPESEAL